VGGTLTGTELIGGTIRNTNSTFTVSANGTIKGATIIGSTFQNAASNPTFKVDSNGNITGANIVGSTFRNANNTFSVSADGAINGATLTAATINSGTINADIINAAGYKIKAVTLQTGEISTPSSSGPTTGKEIPIPSGFSESECVWGITRIARQPYLQLVGRRVYYYSVLAGNDYTTSNTYKARYWILGVKGVTVKNVNV